LQSIKRGANFSIGGSFRGKLKSSRGEALALQAFAVQSPTKFIHHVPNDASWRRQRFDQRSIRLVHTG
jgi:hypothetical protein